MAIPVVSTATAQKTNITSSVPVLLVLFTVLICPASASARFQIERIESDDSSAYVLRDMVTSASARIVPDEGNECVALTLAGPDGRLRELLAPPARPVAPTSGTQRGIPILFPWPGVIPDGRYVHAGKRYQLPRLGRRAPLAMHGFVGRAKWRVEKAEADSHAARLTSLIRSTDCPDMRPGYPFDWSLRVTHSLSTGGLTLEAEVVNEGFTPMPFGFGVHPWFRIPRDKDSTITDCLIQLPAAKVWDGGLVGSATADAVTSISKAGFRSWKLDCPTSLSLAKPVRISAGPTVLYTDLQSSGPMMESRLIDSKGGVETVLQFSKNLNTAVVFRPRGGRFICIEPWSCPPNVFNVAAAGAPETGLVSLKPGERWHASSHFSLRGVSGSTAQTSGGLPDR